MTCCGKKLGSIAKGYTRLATDKIGLTVKSKDTDKRIEICRNCEMGTWLTKQEYWDWLKENGIEVLKSLSDLELLPLLPSFGLDEKRRNLFCRLCKCYAPAKSRVAEEHCPLGKWENNLG